MYILPSLSVVFVNEKLRRLVVISVITQGARLSGLGTLCATDAAATTLNAGSEILMRDLGMFFSTADGS